MIVVVRSFNITPCYLSYSVIDRPSFPRKDTPARSESKIKAFDFPGAQTISLYSTMAKMVGKSQWLKSVLIPFWILQLLFMVFLIGALAYFVQYSLVA